jgi:hypothetical protein
VSPFENQGSFTDRLCIETTDADNLFICFRWLLVYFKREFSLEFVVSLWERLWASTEPRMHLFVAFAILHSHRMSLLGFTAFDQMLRFVNDLSGQLNVIEVLSRARLCSEFFRLEALKDSGIASTTLCSTEEVERLLSW